MPTPQNQNPSLTLSVEQTFQSAERLSSRSPCTVPKQQVEMIGRSLMRIYNGTFLYSGEQRERAATLMKKLASTSGLLVKMLMEDALNYAREQHIDDSFPAPQNSIQVLSGIQPRESVEPFLRVLVATETGVPKWEAENALVAMKCQDDVEIVYDESGLAVGSIGMTKMRELEFLREATRDTFNVSDSLHAAVPVVAAAGLAASIVLAIRYTVAAELAHQVARVIQHLRDTVV